MRSSTLSIHRFLRGTSVAPEELDGLNNIFEDVLRRLCLVDRDDPLTQAIARKLILLHRGGGGS